MKKTFFIAILAIIAIFAMAANVQATEVTTGTDLKNFLEAGNATIELMDNITLSEGISINNGNSITLNLNGKTLTLKGCSIEIKNGTLTVENGSVVSDNDAFRVVSAGSAILNIEANTEVTAVDNAVYIKCPGAVLNTKGHLTSTGGKYAAIQGNGADGSGGITVNIKSGTITSKAEGVYFPNTTELNITGGTITGTTAVFHKSGELNISGGELKANGTKASYVHNSNGCDATGDALVIEASDYPGGVPEVSITGGKFISENNKAIGYYKQAENYKLANENFITGGTFNTDVSEYIAKNVLCKKISDLYNVGKEHSIIVKKVEGGTVTVDKTKAIKGESIYITVTVDNGYKLDGIRLETEKKGSTYSQITQYEMDDDDLTIIPEFSKVSTNVSNSVSNSNKVEEILIESLKNNEELAEVINGKDVEIKVEVKAKEASKTEKEKIETEVNKKDSDLVVTDYMEITITVKDSEEGKTLGNLETVEKTITFTVPVPEDLPEVADGYERVFYIVRNHNGKIELLDAKETSGKLEFESDKFSTYAIAYKDVKKNSDTNINEDETNNSNTSDKTENKENTDVTIPKTGDSVTVYAIIAVVSCIGLAVTIKMRKNK